MRLSDKLRSVGLAIILTWGWKRAVLALAAGALSALAMAPFNAWPVLFLTFSIAVWLIDGAAAGRWRGVPAAALSGFWFGLGYFVLRDLDRHAVEIVMGVVTLVFAALWLDRKSVV